MCTHTELPEGVIHISLSQLQGPTYYRQTIFALARNNRIHNRCTECIDLLIHLLGKMCNGRILVATFIYFSDSSAFVYYCIPYVHVHSSYVDCF